MTSGEEATLQAWMLDKFQGVERAQRLQREAIERIATEHQNDVEKINATMEQLVRDVADFRLVAHDIRDLLSFFKESRETLNHVTRATKFVASKKTWAAGAGVIFLGNWLSEHMPPIHWPWGF